MINLHIKSTLARIFGHHSTLQVFEKDGKFGVGPSAELVPAYTFESHTEAEAFIAEHGKEVVEESA